MKIYLKNLKTYDWELKEGSLKDLKKDLDDRKIIVSETASIGNYARIGNSASIGYKASIGNCASIGDEASIGKLKEVRYGN